MSHPNNENNQHIQSQNEDRFVHSMSQIQKFMDILGRNPDSRTPKQIAVLLEYVSHNRGLTQFAEKGSMKFIKLLLLRYTQMICIDKNRIIGEEGTKITHFYVPVSGKVMTNKRLSEKNQQNQYYSEYERLGMMADDHIRQANKLKNKIKGPDANKQQERVIKKCTKNYKQQQLTEVFTIGVTDRSFGAKFLRDYITVERCMLLQISIDGFFTALAAVYHEKIKYLYDIMHAYPCFKNCNRDIVYKFIMSLAQKKKKRGSYIYKQNQATKSLYVLTEGEIKLTKQTNLLAEDPNNLYANRLQLMLEGSYGNQQNSKKLQRYKPLRHSIEKQKSLQKSREQQQIALKPKYLSKQEQINKQKAILPYADLSLMFNYEPKKKTIEISKVHAFCIFGGEELFQNKDRQTNAVCNSLDVSYYQISISKIQEIMGKNMPNFIKGLKVQAKHRVLHRQKHYANTMNLENQSNLDYFYFEGQQEKKSPTKFRIAKLNSKIQENKSKDDEKKYKSIQRNLVTPPQFTAFNFNKLQGKQLKQISTPQSLAKHNSRSSFNNPELQSRKKNVSQSDDQNQNFPKQPNVQEMKIINITHTWKIIQSKVDAQEVKSYKISSKKHTIDVNEPLIDNSFFTNLDREKRRVQRKIRKDRITLGQSRTTAKVQKIHVNF